MPEVADRDAAIRRRASNPAERAPARAGHLGRRPHRPAGTVPPFDERFGRRSRDGVPHRDASRHARAIDRDEIRVGGVCRILGRGHAPGSRAPNLRDRPVRGARHPLGADRDAHLSGRTVDRVQHRVLRLAESARWLEPPLGAVPSQDQRRDQRAEPQLVGVLPDRRARRRGDAGHPRQVRVLHRARSRGKDELPGRPVPQLRHHPVGAGFVPETADRHAGRPRTVDARELGIGRAGWDRGSLQTPCIAVQDLDQGAGSSRLRAEVRRGHVLAADRDAVRVGATRDRQEEAVAVLERRDGRARRPCPAGRPHRERDPDRVPAARRADGDAPLRHRARKSTEDGLGDGDGNRDGLRRDRGDRPGGDQREDGDARDDQQPTIASPPRCADLVAVLRARRLLPTTDPLPQAHGAIMQLSNADSGLIVVPPSGVFMLSGPTSDAGASAVKQPSGRTAIE